MCHKNASAPTLLIQRIPSGRDYALTNRSSQVLPFLKPLAPVQVLFPIFIPVTDTSS